MVKFSDVYKELEKQFAPSGIQSTHFHRYLGSVLQHLKWHCVVKLVDTSFWSTCWKYLYMHLDINDTSDINNTSQAYSGWKRQQSQLWLTQWYLQVQKTQCITCTEPSYAKVSLCWPVKHHPMETDNTLFCLPSSKPAVDFHHHISYIPESQPHTINYERKQKEIRH